MRAELNEGASLEGVPQASCHILGTADDMATNKGT